MSTSPGKVLVIGATGKVGQHVVKELQARSINVRALVRNPDSANNPLLALESGPEMIKGDVTDAAAVSRALEGVEVVIDVHGVAPLRFSRISDLWSDPEADPTHPAAVNFGGVRNIVSACQGQGVKHIVRLTGLSVSMPASSPVVAIFNSVLSFTTKWHRRSEILLREQCVKSGINYTVVQPSGLRDSPKASLANSVLLLECEANASRPTLPPASGISREDVASLCVEALFKEECKNTTLRCISLPNDQALPVGAQSASDWKPLLKTVRPDSETLADQSYVTYSLIFMGIFAGVTCGIVLGVGKLTIVIIAALT